MSRYVVEKDGERQSVLSLSGYEDWTLVATVSNIIPDGEAELVEGKWVIPMGILRERRWDDVKLFRELYRYSGCQTAKGRMNNDPESRAALTNTALTVPDDTITNWVMENNEAVPHTQAELAAAAAAMTAFDLACHQTGQSLRERIERATVPASLTRIDIPGAGWPS